MEPHVARSNPRQLALLAGVVRHYISTHRKRQQADLDWFRGQPALDAAIERAALATDARGKRRPHQRRLKATALQAARNALLLAANQFRACASFDDLIDLVDLILRPLNGVGELYVYDTSLAIGAHLGVLPNKVYLHSGTRVGAGRLGLNTRKVRTLEIRNLPAPLHELTGYEAEDVLCIYKDKFRD